MNQNVLFGIKVGENPKFICFFDVFPKKNMFLAWKNQKNHM